MIIRCPHCDHTRTINTDKIPPSAELATCPRCKNRFRFRALEKADAPVFDSPKDQSGGQPERGYREQAAERPKPVRQKPSQAQVPPSHEDGASSPQGISPILTPPQDPRPAYAMQEVQRPQSAFREAAEKAGTDLWDAVDVLHRRWENQMDQHVTEVVTPRPSPNFPMQQAATARRDAQATRMEPALTDHEERAGARNKSMQDSENSFPSMSDLYESMADEEADSKIKERQFAASNIAARTLVNYSEQGSSPEDIVDQDIRILQHSSEEQRPMRDLGKLNTIRDPRDAPEEDGEREAYETQAIQTPSFASTPQPAPSPAPVSAPFPQPTPDKTPVAQQNSVEKLQEPEEESQVPWENHDEFGGWFKALLTTIYLVMMRGPSFYSNLGKAGAPLKHCYLFFLILGYIAIIGSVLWAEISMLIIQDAPPLVDNLLTLPVLLITAPLLLGLMQLFVTGCMRLQLKLLAPERSDFSTSFRITAYSVAPFVMCLVPFVGPSIGAAWFAFALTTGCRYALGLSWVYSIAVTLPPAGLLIGGLCWFFLT